MPWSLEIHQIDVRSVGDATLIIARNIDPPNAPVVQSLLIDGGKRDRGGAIVDNYIRTVAGLTRLNAMVATHYDEDHFTGLTYLMNRTTNPSPYDNVIIYDQGEPPHNEDFFSQTYKNRRLNDGTVQNVLIPTDYQNYIAAIQTKPHALRATALVNSFDIVNYVAPANNAAIPLGNIMYQGTAYLDPAWLVGKEILWGNGGDGQNGRPAFASNPPVGAPTVTCIAVNKYVAQVGGGVCFVSNLDIYDGPNRMPNWRIRDAENADDNAKSLAFVIEFNNFRYYLGGDITSYQEDGCNNRNMNPMVFQPGIRALLNPTGTMVNRITAMKSSHHGSNTTTSRTFVSQMQPSATLISTGQSNQHRHPAQPTVNILDGYPAVPILADQANANRHPPQPPIPPQRQSRYYITGYRVPNANPPLTFAGDAGITAGDPLNAIPGDIVLSVTQLQSQIAQTGQIYRGVLAAIGQIVAVTHLVLAAGIDVTIADAAATFGIGAAVAFACNANATTVTNGIPINNAYQAAVNAVAYAGNDAAGLGVVSSAVAALAGGAAAITTAAAAVAGGQRVTAIGAGSAEAIGQAMMGANAVAISNAARNANPAATAAAANAAGFAADWIYQAIQAANYITPLKEYNAGYAVAAAMGAATGGATVDQATAIAIALAATYPVGLDLANNELFADGAEMAAWVTQAALNAGMNNDLAALSGAVAAAAYYEGDPAETGAGVVAALTTIQNNGAGINGIDVAGTQAQVNATLAQNVLFQMTFYNRDQHKAAVGNINIPHSW